MITHKLSLYAIAGLVFSQAALFAQTQNYAPYPYPHAASLDGFPVSGDALTAKHQFMQSGFLGSSTSEELQSFYGESSANSAMGNNAVSTSDSGTILSGEERGSFEIIPEYGAFSVPNLDGNTYTLPLYANYKLTDRVGLSLNLPLQYTEFRGPGGDLDVWNPDLTIGLPVKIIKRTKDLPLSWTVTPHGGAGVYFANDAGNSHTWVGHGGVTSMLGYETRYFSVSMANQITWFETMARRGSYEFTDGVDQKVLKNGLKLSVPFCTRWVFDVYGVDTEFLSRTYLTRFQTVGTSIGYHRPTMKKGAYLKLGTYTEFSGGFQSITFQAGTGWKF